MKWLFFALLLVNLGLAAFQWVKHREQYIMPVFVDDDSVSKIALLSDDFLESEAVGKERCVLLGPLVNEVDIVAIRNISNGDGGFLRVVEQKTKKAPSYWVYIASESYKDEFFNASKEIGIDGYRVASGELKGAFSLGVFDNIDLARKLVKKSKLSGMNAEILERKKHDLSYWVEYGVDYASENQAKIAELQALLPKELKKREIFCKSVASEK